LKVVLFCGGRGLRMQEASRRIPKPMIRVGDRPVLWHVMKYYAHFGHTEFILCLGHKAEVIKDYFLTYNEALSNDFVLTDGGQKVTLLGEDITEWKISFVHTGYAASVGERLARVRDHIGDDPYFLANYGDVLTDAYLPQVIDDVMARGVVACFLSVAPSYSFHSVRTDTEGIVEAVDDVREAGIRINGGHFVLRREIFDHMHPGDELVTDTFSRLIPQRQVMAWRHDGFWAPMDTLKEQQELEAMVEAGGGPWRLWEHERANGSATDSA
jgi:glucose-1-phosphate cytidylyltransferase